MSQSASHYPVSQLINRLMQERGYSTIEFVQSLGYRNIERGLLRLVPWLEQGEGFEKILKQIAATFPQHADELQRAVAQTKAVRAAEFDARWIEQCKAEAHTFRPFIHADGTNTVLRVSVYSGSQVGIGDGLPLRFRRTFWSFQANSSWRRWRD